MAIVMAPARVGSGQVPSIIYGQYDDAAAIVLGSVLAYSSGEYTLAGTDPALIAGVALQAKDTAPGYAAQNNPTVITGRLQNISIAVADAVTVFMATLTNGSSTRVAPAITDVGAQYGITAYSGVWTVDRNKTTTSARVIVVGYSTELYGSPGVVFFKWLTDHIAGAA